MRILASTRTERRTVKATVPATGAPRKPNGSDDEEPLDKDVRKKKKKAPEAAEVYGSY